MVYNVIDFDLGPHFETEEATASAVCFWILKLKKQLLLLDVFGFCYNCGCCKVFLLNPRENRKGQGSGLSKIVYCGFDTSKIVFLDSPLSKTLIIPCFHRTHTS
ncbi:hypothetical protein LINPERHAP1_LOCUS38882 [Linum perenne]